MVAAGFFGFSAFDVLSAGGYRDPSSQSSRAQRVLAEKFDYGDQQLVFEVTTEAGAQSEAARKVATDIVAHLKASSDVAQVSSAWTLPPPAAAGLISKDGKTGLIVAGIRGGETNAQKNAAALAKELVHDRDGVTVQAGGEALTYAQINKQSEKDLLLMESIAFPLSFVVLVWVFGGMLAAAIPMAVGGFAIVCTLATLRAITLFADVSIFALNLTVAMGLALAIDYTLLIISRYRDELADGVQREDALVRTMCTAGRTVLFSATTVALSMATMVLFPMYFLKSFAYAGVAVVALAAVAAVVITPALIVLLGDRLDMLNVRRLLRRVGGRPEPVSGPIQASFLYRSTKAVMRRPVSIGVAVIAFLFALGSPFLGANWGFSDDRVLPTSASARQVGDDMRSDFVVDADTDVTVVIPDASGLAPAEIERYALQLSRVADVVSVSTPGGTFQNGASIGPPAAPTGAKDGSVFLTVRSADALFSIASERQLDRLRAIAGPGGRDVQLTGRAGINRDSAGAVTSRLPLVLSIIALITFALLFVLTGSVVMPLKALVLNVLSLTAAFGALVWIFQEGHLGALGTTANGTLMVHMPVLLFCIAFGLSMDYEVFLVSRIREHWLASDRTPEDNDEAVALGVARSGRVVTAAALLMSISFAALIAARVSFMRMFGLGLTLAVVVDATLVRMLLLPAFMRLMGRANWWAPEPLAKLHERIGINEEEGDVRPRALSAGQ
jgi:RND superfamily putative drug exporter